MLLERRFVLSELFIQVRVGIALPQFFRYFRGNAFHIGTSLFRLHKVEKIQFAVFHDLNAQVKQRLNRRVAGQEIKRPRPERNDLQDCGRR